jgi:hypothetical protein
LRWSSYGELQRSFFVGAAMLALLLLFREGVDGVPRVSLLVPLAAFAGCSLLALALVSFSHAIALDQTTDSGNPSPPRQWLLVLSAWCGILALGWLLTLALSPGLLRGCSRIPGPDRAFYRAGAAHGFGRDRPICSSCSSAPSSMPSVTWCSSGCRWTTWPRAASCPACSTPEMLANLDVPPGAQTGIQIIVIAC